MCCAFSIRSTDVVLVLHGENQPKMHYIVQLVHETGLGSNFAKSENLLYLNSFCPKFFGVQ